MRSVETIVALAQIAAAIATGILAYLTFRYVRARQEMARSNEAMLNEMREGRTSQDEANRATLHEMRVAAPSAACH